MILSNVELNGVRDQVRTAAMEDFGFFANTVLASGLPDDLCRYVQDALRDQDDVVLHTLRPRNLIQAIQAWLASQGVAVLTTVELPRHEVLQWLEFQEPQGGEAAPVAVTLELLPNGVRVQWL